MNQEERNIWDHYFAAAVTGLLAKPVQSGTNTTLLSGLGNTPQAIVTKGAQYADAMLEERRKR